MSDLPYQLVPGAEWRVSWLHADGARYTEPFFEDSLRRIRAHRSNRAGPLRTTSLGELAHGPGLEPDAIIFHVSRCGSTLLAQMLAALPQHTVLAEPPLADEIIRLPRRRPATTEAEQIAWLRGAIAALARPHAATSRRVFVKLDCWHLFAWPLVRAAFPRTPLLFLHRHPVEVLASLNRRPSLTLVRDTVGPEQLGLTRAARDALPPLEHAAAILGAFFRVATAAGSAFHRIAYDQLPDYVLHALPGVAFAPAEQDLLATAAQRDAKDPTRVFAPDAAHKRRTASPELWAAAERWTLPSYHEFLAPESARRPPDFRSRASE